MGARNIPRLWFIGSSRRRAGGHGSGTGTSELGPTGVRVFLESLYRTLDFLDYFLFSVPSADRFPAR
jgi:hypothetical protein